MKQTEDRMWLGAGEINFQRSSLQSVSFKTRPIKTLGASLNGPSCLTLLQALVAPDSGPGPLGRLVSWLAAQWLGQTQFPWVFL